MRQNLPKETPELQKAVTSKIRRHRLPLGASLLIRMHEVSDLSIRDLRYLMGDRRAKLKSTMGSNERTFELAPGFKFVKILEFLCRKKTIEHVIEPMHAEFLVEYYEAIKAQRELKARYIKGQMHFYLVYAVMSEKVFSLIGKWLIGPFKAK